MNYYQNKNPLIALFMGAEQKGKPGDIWFAGLAGHGACDVNDLRYHKDWNWMMDALTRIKTLIVPEQETKEVQLQLEEAMIKWWEHLLHQLCILNLDQLWISVVGFIEWWNQQPTLHVHPPHLINEYDNN